MSSYFAMQGEPAQYHTGQLVLLPNTSCNGISTKGGPNRKQAYKSSIESQPGISTLHPVEEDVLPGKSGNFPH